jgi:hypothetical protein
VKVLWLFTLPLDAPIVVLSDALIAYCYTQDLDQLKSVKANAYDYKIVVYKISVILPLSKS